MTNFRKLGRHAGHRMTLVSQLVVFTPQPPQRVPLDPWDKSRLMKQVAPPKEEKISDSEL
ncbi:unnamed protein product [Brassica oleracea var. botrytis]|uniref:Uncharacterized protein n=1 Tax=Brassica oleracea var. oleracea TaxID=109376 RepID=A0A0D3B0E2_BRAOL